MSKNTGNTKFRKIDVDQYSEDRYEEDLITGEDQGPQDGEVSSLLAGGKNQAALQYVLNSAPVMSKNQQVKDKALQLTMKVILSFKSAEIDQAVKSLNQDQLDVLMKYIYKGFEIPSEGSSAILLSWHEKTFAIGGLGSIVRVLTDRKRV